MMNINLRNNQRKAIKSSIDNNFSSGIHFHATGTGKSWIALELILEYNRRNPRKNILWMCEQKSILIDQFNEKTIREKGYSSIFDIFDIKNYSEKKPKKWYDEISVDNKKAILLIINRSFLVSRQNYKNINADIDLIIHDECHSIKNKTTREFYQYITEKNKSISCIGFSATPYLEIKPFDKIITEYTIYDAFCDDIIVPPKISWVSNEGKLSDIDFIKICEEKITDLPYKKIIVWCGIIDKCYELSKLWQNHFKDFYIAVDTSRETKSLFNEFNSSTLS